MKAAVAATGFDPERLEIVITQMVNLFRAGEPIRMSMRAGEFITLREVMEEVGADATRYYLAAVSPDTAINFDLEPPVGLGEHGGLQRVHRPQKHVERASTYLHGGLGLLPDAV